jgi:hypothetical protein
MRPIRDLVMSDALVKHERLVSQAITRAEVRGILKFCQSIRHRITYVCLAKALGMFSGGTELAKILGEIMLEDYEAKEGVLSSLVVKSTTGLPGHGYFTYAKKLYPLQLPPSLGTSDVQFWRAQMNALRWGHTGAINIIIGSTSVVMGGLHSLTQLEAEYSKVFTTKGSPPDVEAAEKDLGVDE